MIPRLVYYPPPKTPQCFENLPSSSPGDGTSSRPRRPRPHPMPWCWHRCPRWPPVADWDEVPRSSPRSDPPATSVATPGRLLRCSIYFKKKKMEEITLPEIVVGNYYCKACFLLFMVFSPSTIGFWPTNDMGMIVGDDGDIHHQL